MGFVEFNETFRNRLHSCSLSQKFEIQNLTCLLKRLQLIRILSAVKYLT
jgi:hypothetical protein